jgi:hypothetical protein
MKVVAVLAAMALACMAGALSPPASAQGNELKVDGRLAGKLKDANASKLSDRYKKSEDVSGIACLPGNMPRKCLVIDDDVAFAQVVIVTADGIRAGDIIPLVPNFDTALSLDGEGVAFSQGSGARPDYFYIIGSHGAPRDPTKTPQQIQEQMTASSKLIRIPVGGGTIGDDGKVAIQPDVRSFVDLGPHLQAFPLLAEKYGKPLEDRGLTIEGIAAAGGRIFVGMRAPTAANDHAFVLSLDEEALFAGKPADARLLTVQVSQGRGIRDLAAHDGRILILAGLALKTDKPEDAGIYSILSWDGTSTATTKLLDLPLYTKVSAKTGKPHVLQPEALLPLSRHSDGTLDILILLDGADEGGPRIVRTTKP